MTKVTSWRMSQKILIKCLINRHDSLTGLTTEKASKYNNDFLIWHLNCSVSIAPTLRTLNRIERIAVKDYQALET